MANKLVVEVDIEIPGAPYFLKLKRQGKEAGDVSVGELSNKQLRKVIDAWGEELMKNAAKHRGAKDTV